MKHRSRVAGFLLLLPTWAAASTITMTTEASLAEVVPAIVSAASIGDSRHTVPPGTGVARLLMSMTNEPGQFICSGSVLNANTILTAAHCVSDDFGKKNLASGSARVLRSDNSTQTLGITGTSIHPLWNGDLFGGYDVALIRVASAFTNISTFGLYSLFNEIGQTYDVYGWGRQGSNGAGIQNVSWGSVSRTGKNTFDATITSGMGPLVLMSDFDDGTAQRDAFAVHFGFAPHTGLGLPEVSTAPGDSGGPALIGGMIAGITSFGLRIGSPSDLDGTLNSSFGEFNGFTRVSSHVAWIQGNHTYLLAPEPGTWAFAASGVAFLWIRRPTS
jgi:V8-like Glu-specific endopeptidase